MVNRRKFLHQSALATGTLLLPGIVTNPLEAAERVERLTILHTNDVHSRLEPFPMDGSRNQGLGGVVARAQTIAIIRQQQDHVLLLDAGDMFQGTPYFNFYKGAPEIKAMTAMGYDAGTIGNHDFDAGLENLSTQLQYAGFPLLICNYDFTNTPMENKFQPYKIFRKGKLQIGVTGVGIEMQGLVPDNLAGNTKYFDPITKASETAHYLKKIKKCDMVICLSHLGFKYNDNKLSDVILAKESDHVDLILGGHTHTFMEAPQLFKNRRGDDVIVNQVGWAGIILGRLDFTFQRGKKKNLEMAHSVVIEKKTSE
jgi:5'-nucleotidase